MNKEVNEERAPRTVEDVKEMLAKHSNGEIQRTIQNCITILQNDHVLADAIRLNLLSERIDIVKPVGWPRSGKTLSDTDMRYILRRLDDDNVYRKLQGHWIIEMSEMIATANAKSIEEIKSFLSKQKETYKVPYETHPADRLRQCVFAGTTNRQDFCPVTAPATAVSSLFRWMRNWPKSTFWTMKKNPVPISTSSGQKL